MIDGVVRTSTCEVDPSISRRPKSATSLARRPAPAWAAVGRKVFGKTTDGGHSWQFTMGPGDPKRADLEDVFFLDEQRGLVHVKEADARKLFVTTDEGETWRGVVSTPAPSCASPIPKWAGRSISTGSRDGRHRRRWKTLDLSTAPLPDLRARLELPAARSRVYRRAEGDDLRYRVVPVSEPLKSRPIAAPQMPAFASSLDDEVVKIGSVVTRLGTTGTVGVDAAAAETAGSFTQSAGDESAPPPSTEELAALPLSDFTTDCCTGPSASSTSC